MKKIVSSLFITSATLGLSVSVVQADETCTRQPQPVADCAVPVSLASPSPAKLEQSERRVSQAQSELKNAHAIGDQDQIKEKQNKLRKAQYELSEIKAFF
jgi:hypothetical protein